MTSAVRQGGQCVRQVADNHGEGGTGLWLILPADFQEVPQACRQISKDCWCQVLVSSSMRNLQMYSYDVTYCIAIEIWQDRDTYSKTSFSYLALYLHGCGVVLLIRRPLPEGLRCEDRKAARECPMSAPDLQCLQGDLQGIIGLTPHNYLYTSVGSP